LSGKRFVVHRPIVVTHASNNQFPETGRTTGDVIMRSFLSTTGIVLLLALTGCQHYYMIQEPEGGKVYYTDHFDRADNNAVLFKDLQTGAMVTLQNNEVKEIHKGDLPPGLVN
jgi:hypothetical protein